MDWGCLGKDKLIKLYYMKKVLLLALLFVGISASAQWETIEATDEFGDPTGKTRTVMTLKGVFKNSATAGDKAVMFLEKDEGGIGFVLRDYGGATNTYYNHTFVIAIKKSDDTVIKDVKVINTYSSTSGYNSVKWISFQKIKYPNMSIDEAKKRIKAIYKEHGGILKYKTWPEEVLTEWSHLNVVKSGTKQSPLFDGFMNLESGDRILVKEGTSVYRFTID